MHPRRHAVNDAAHTTSVRLPKRRDAEAVAKGAARRCHLQLAPPNPAGLLPLRAKQPDGLAQARCRGHLCAALVLAERDARIVRVYAACLPSNKWATGKQCTLIKARRANLSQMAAPLCQRGTACGAGCRGGGQRRFARVALHVAVQRGRTGGSKYG